MVQKFPHSAKRAMQAGLAVLGLAMGGGAQAQSTPAPVTAPATASANGSIEADGTVVVPSFRLPPSAYASAEARAAMPRKPNDPEMMMQQVLASGRVTEIRGRMAQLVAARNNQLKALFPVTTEDLVIAGVPAVRILPVAPMPAANRHKILLNLPGGGFIMASAHGTGMSESVPVAALAGVEIVSITYRQAPEAHFPAGTEDVVKVYRELLKTHRPQDIGVFGCSAGGVLTAEAMVAFMHENLPLPAAIGIFCAAADARFTGDSHYTGRSFQALPPRDPALDLYFTEAEKNTPEASPVLDPALLRRFPPTLIITATRAMEMSSAINTHRELVKAGVDADLHVWDGLGHDFFMDVTLPESREAFDVMAHFFREKLRLR